MFRRLRRVVQTRKPVQTRPVEQVWLAQYNTYDARAYFSQLLERAGEGEVIVIARAGVPIAKLAPYDGEGPRRPGVVRAHLVMHEPRPPIAR